MPIRILKKDKSKKDTFIEGSKVAASKLKNTDANEGFKTDKKLTGGQAKLDKNKNNKLDAQDFKILRAEKAKGRGQGLQDEKMKPGKPMKAVLGALALGAAGALGAKKILGRKKKATAMPTNKMPVGDLVEQKKKQLTGKRMGGVMKARMGKRIRVKDDDSFDTKMKLQEKGVIDKKTGAGRERITKAMKATRLGRIVLPIAAAGVAASQYLKSKMKKKDKKMGGGMMKVPGYVSGTDKMGVKPKIKYSSSVGKTVTIKDGRIALTDPDTPKAGPKAGRPKAPPPPRKRRLPQQARRSVGKRTGLGALGGTGRKEDSSVTLGKFMKAKTDALNESVKAGGMKKERITQGSNMRRPAAFVKDVEAGKYNKPNKDAAYYKSIGLTGERGDRAVKDFFKPSDIRLKNIMAGNYMGGGMMNKPMGYKSGKSIKVKCKLGKNKPTKMY